jgi:hypothetical protein
MVLKRRMNVFLENANDFLDSNKMLRLQLESKQPSLNLFPSFIERWPQEFVPVVKVVQLVKEMIQNNQTKEPFARFRGHGCAGSESQLRIVAGELNRGKTSLDSNIKCNG